MSPFARRQGAPYPADRRRLLTRNANLRPSVGDNVDRHDGSTQGSRRIRRLEPTQDVVGQRLGNEVVLVSLQTNRIFELNRTGGRFWELLQTESDRGRIEERLLEEFEVSQEELAAEVDQLIESLADEELVRIIEHD
jgi:Coenzyme PQQ synthesis protein D (PqqD)